MILHTGNALWMAAEIADAPGLTHMQRFIIAVVRQLPNPTNEDIANYLKIGVGTVSNNMTDIKRAGYLQDFRPKSPPKNPGRSIPRRLWIAVILRDKQCMKCGTVEDLACDHVIPFSKGGMTTLENLQALCRRCNSRKGARL